MPNAIYIEGLIKDPTTIDLDDLFYGPPTCSSDDVQYQLDYCIDPGIRNVDLFIDTLGGSVGEGYKIYNTLKGSNLNFTTHIIGKCYSIGTVIALIGKKIIAPELSSWCVHFPAVQPDGENSYTADQLQTMVDQLRAQEEQFIQLYLPRVTAAGKTETDLRELMAKDTVLTAMEAKDWGFIDEVIPAMQMVALYDNSITANKSKAMANDTNKTLSPEATQKLTGIMARVAKFLSPKAEGEEAPLETPPAGTGTGENTETAEAKNSRLEKELADEKAARAADKTAFEESQKVLEESSKTATAEITALKKGFSEISAELNATFGTALKLGAPEGSNVGETTRVEAAGKSTGKFGSVVEAAKKKAFGSH